MWLWDQSIHKIFNDIAVVNECSSSPCNNNGHCVNLEAGYTCICQLGFDGERCESGQLIFLKIMTIAYTRQNLLYGMLYKLQGLANLIHVTTMVHVSLTECLHFAHVWRDSLGKIVHKVNLNYLFSILHHSLFGTCFRFTIILAVRGLFFNYKTWMSVCMTHVMTTSLAKTQSVAMNVCPVPRLTIVLTNRVSICKYY